MSIKEEKQYGLIISKKQQLTAPKAANIFEDDDASDEQDDVDWVRKALKAESEKNKKKQIKLSVQKALTEDPTIYQYDEVYDDLERNKNQVKTDKIKEKKPLYIQNLLKAAERRKKEQEHRIERMVQKEREAEGEMFADKESFVTSAYRAKLEEFRKMEEEDARMERLESIGDVTKQQDMSGFYRQLYRQTMDNENKSKDNSSQEENKIKIEKEIKENEEKVLPVKTKKNRQYRQRVMETYESDSDTEKKEEEVSQKEIKSTNDTNDKNIDNHANSEEPLKKKQKLESEEIKPQLDNHSDSFNPTLQEEIKDDTKTVENRLQNIDDNSKNTENEKENNMTKKSEEVKKERSSIWIKRTVGPVFEAALQRYYARKAARCKTITT